MKACDKMFSEEGSWFKGHLRSRLPITESMDIPSSVSLNMIIIPTFEKY